MARLVVTFIGNNGVGNISVPGLKIGDQVLAIVSDAINGSNVNANFFSFVTTKNELRQIAVSDFSSYTLSALIERHVML